MEKKELLYKELEDVTGGLTCNHDLKWAGMVGGVTGPDGHTYQYNAWNCDKCNILRFTKLDLNTNKRVFVPAQEFFALGGTIIL